MPPSSSDCCTLLVEMDEVRRPEQVGAHLDALALDGGPQVFEHLLDAFGDVDSVGAELA